MIYDSDYLRTLKAHKRAERWSEILFFTALTSCACMGAGLVLWTYAVRMAPITIILQPF